MFVVAADNCVLIIQLLNFKIEKYERFGNDYLGKVKNESTDSNYVCNTCAGYIKQGKIPTMCLSNGLEFDVIPKTVKILTTMEERMICPRLKPTKGFNRKCR